MEDEHFERRTKEICIVPQRIVTLLLVFLAFSTKDFLNYSRDEILDIVITTKLEKEANVSTTTQHPEACKYKDIKNDTIISVEPLPHNIRQIYWNPAVLQAVNAIYRWSTEAGVIVALFVDKHGGRSYLSASVCTVTASRVLYVIYMEATGAEHVGLMVLDFVAGISSSAMYPILYSIMSNWIPQREFGRTFAFYSVIHRCVKWSALSFVKLIILNSGSWSTPIYLFGTLGVLFIILWISFGHSNYRESPYVTEKEYRYLEEELGPHLNFNKKAIPLRYILTSVPFYAMTVALCGHGYLMLGYRRDFPTYTSTIVQVDVLSIFGNKIFSDLPGAISTVVGGFVFDYVVNHDYIDKTMARKVFAIFGTMAPAIFCLVGVYAGCFKSLMKAYYILTTFFLGCYYHGFKFNIMDLAPNYTGFLKTIAELSYVPLKVIAEIYIKTKSKSNNTLKQWQTVFWIYMGVSIFTVVICTLFGSAQIQMWNNPEEYRRREREAQAEKDRIKRDRGSSRYSENVMIPPHLKENQ